MAAILWKVLNWINVLLQPLLRHWYMGLQSYMYRRMEFIWIHTFEWPVLRIKNKLKVNNKKQMAGNNVSWQYL